MGDSYTEGRHVINKKNYTGWEVGFGTFYFMSWVNGYGDPGLWGMNFFVLIGYVCILYGIFLLIMYATYDGSYYKIQQLQEEIDAITEGVSKLPDVNEEMKPLLNSTQLKF